MTARAAILARVRVALGRDPLSPDPAAAERINGHPTGPIPARSQLTGESLAGLFVSMAEGVSATVERLAKPAEILPAVARTVAADVPAPLAVAPHEFLKQLNWNEFSNLRPRFGGGRGQDSVALTFSAAGIAETGTLVFISSPECPSDLCFLPETQIAVLRKIDIIGSYEEFWARLRQTGLVPATINLVTGPSRTGDIEQTIQLGAHGPRRLHILIVG